MKKLTLPLLLTILSATLVAAATAESLELGIQGQVKVLTDSLGELQITTQVVGTSTGAWVGVSAKTKATPSSGTEVESVREHVFSDGSSIMLTMKTKIDQQKVTVKSTWLPGSSAKGFVRTDLKVPFEVASDLTIESGGKLFFTGFDGPFPNYKNVSELVFKKTSTGAFLFKVIGEIVGGGIVLSSEKPDDGITVRISTGLDSMDSTMSDVTEAGWAISFQE
jgi:hypothetical protein